jgi:hypothetical protein
MNKLSHEKLEKLLTMINIFIDNGGRRSGMDRRFFLYAAHLPERRSGKDRRGWMDRRGNGVNCHAAERSTGDRRAYSNKVVINKIECG